MARGRPARPLRIHKLLGSYRSDRHGQDVDPEPSIPPCPDWLSECAKAHWQPISEMLFGLGIMSERHSAALALLCDALADWIRFSKLAEDENPTAERTLVFSRKWAAWERVLKIIREFGMTPAAARSVGASSKKPASGLPALKLA